MAPTVVHLTQKSGDTMRLQFPVVNEDGSAANITGATPRFEMFDRDTGEVVLTSEGVSPGAPAVITNAVGGIFEVISEAEITDLYEGAYYYEAEITDLSGNVSTVTEGSILFTRQRLFS